jgi:hypothetical protein
MAYCNSELSEGKSIKVFKTVPCGCTLNVKLGIGGTAKDKFLNAQVGA